MEPMVTFDEKRAFAERLNEVLDDANFPAKHGGRQTELGKVMGVSQKGARKWVEGESIPETSRMIEMAKHFGVSFEWLATGRGSKALGAEATPTSLGATQQARTPWPFSFSQERFERLPDLKRVRIDAFALGIISDWEAESAADTAQQTKCA